MTIVDALGVRTAWKLTDLLTLFALFCCFGVCMYACMYILYICLNYVFSEIQKERNPGIVTLVTPVMLVIYNATVCHFFKKSPAGVTMYPTVGVSYNTLRKHRHGYILLFSQSHIK